MNNRKKDTGSFFKRYLKSFKHGFDGINYAIEKETNMLVMMMISLIVLVGCFFLKVSTIELAVIVVCIGVVFAAELINCAIEATVDLNTLEENKLAKIAKDSSTGAILILSIISIFVAGIILIPKIIALF